MTGSTIGSCVIGQSASSESACVRCCSSDCSAASRCRATSSSSSRRRSSSLNVRPEEPSIAAHAGALRAGRCLATSVHGASKDEPRSCSGELGRANSSFFAMGGSFTVGSIFGLGSRSAGGGGRRALRRRCAADSGDASSSSVTSTGTGRDAGDFFRSEAAAVGGPSPSALPASASADVGVFAAGAASGLITASTLLSASRFAFSSTSRSLAPSRTRLRIDSIASPQNFLRWRNVSRCERSRDARECCTRLSSCSISLCF